MSKKNVLISAALTTFVLVILVNLGAVYARIRDAVTIQPAIQPTMAIVEALPAQAQVVQVTHQEAASIAANFLGQNDVYSVENVVWNEVDAYKVVFSSGTIVYVSMDGQILGSEAPQPVFIYAPSSNNNDQPQPSNVSAHSKDHDDHDDHEEGENHEDHDD